jgi:hypothetical protein
MHRHATPPNFYDPITLTPPSHPSDNKALKLPPQIFGGRIFRPSYIVNQRIFFIVCGARSVKKRILFMVLEMCIMYADPAPFSFARILIFKNSKKTNVKDSFKFPFLYNFGP